MNANVSKAWFTVSCIIGLIVNLFSMTNPQVWVIIVSSIILMKTLLVIPNMKYLFEKEQRKVSEKYFILGMALPLALFLASFYLSNLLLNSVDKMLLAVLFGGIVLYLCLEARFFVYPKYIHLGQRISSEGKEMTISLIQSDKDRVYLTSDTSEEVKVVSLSELGKHSL